MKNVVYKFKHIVLNRAELSMSAYASTVLNIIEEKDKSFVILKVKL